jgi:hypothetical protein
VVNNYAFTPEHHLDAPITKPALFIGNINDPGL